MSFITFSITSFFHNLVLFFFTLSAVLQYPFLQYLPCHHHPFFLDSKQCQWFFCGPAAISSYIYVKRLSYMLCVCTNTTVISCCACFKPVKMALIKTENPFISPLSCQKNVVLKISLCV